MKETLYSRRSNLVIGFHGCDKSVVNKVIVGEDNLIASTNDYDWLGHGIYFGRIMKLVHYNMPMKCSKEGVFLLQNRLL